MKPSTPINIEKLAEELRSHLNINFASYLLNGLRHGFDAMVKCETWETKECKNNFSARSQPEIVSELIQKECDKGFVYGPFKSPPFQNCRLSPLGVATGKYSDKKRLILDLSSPHNDTCVSVNDMIDKTDCSMSYVKIDDAIRIILKCGKGSKLCKFDISDAFKIVLISLHSGLCFVLNGTLCTICMLDLLLDAVPAPTFLTTFRKRFDILQRETTRLCISCIY
jgi:hypothetical protein